MRLSSSCGSCRQSGPTRTSGIVRGWAAMLALLAVLFAGGCATVPTEYREPPKLAAAERTKLNLQVFDRAWELVNERYFDATFHGVDWPAMRGRYRLLAAQAPDDVALYRELNKMCAELKESHLAALSPRRTHELGAEHRPAVGLRWQLVEGKRVIVDVIPGGPAAAAGIERGWIVVSRDGVPLREGDTFITRLGQPVTFGFLDARDQPRTFTLEPQLLNFERQDVRELDDGFVYLRFDKFSAESLSWLSRQLKAHRSAPGVVIDLRQNGGGNVLALNVAVAEFFDHRVDEGRQVQRNGRARESRSLAWLSAQYAGRVALLTSANTASAAEIFSHVLQHHHRAVVVGQKTAGAVIYARSYKLPGGGSLQVPVIDFVGLDGQRLEGRGVTPDVPTRTANLQELRTGRDPELEAGLGAIVR